MPYRDDMNIVNLTQAAGAFRRLCVDDDGVRIGLEPRIPKCIIYGGDEEQVAAEAAKLRMAHQLDGLTAVGTPLGSAEYVSNALGRRAATVETLVESLVQLPLTVQSQFLLMRASLQARMGHLMLTVHREPLAMHACVARTLQCGRRQPNTTTGISSSSTPCSGSVILDPRVGRHVMAVKYTVVELPLQPSSTPLTLP